MVNVDVSALVYVAGEGATLWTLVRWDSVPPAVTAATWSG